MPWTRLFDDLESEMDHEAELEQRGIALEEERLRLGRLGLRERLAAVARATDAGVRLDLDDGASILVRPTTFGRDWLAGELLERQRRRPQCIVPLAAIAAVAVDGAQLETSLEPEPAASARLAERIGLAFALRDLCRRRIGVTVSTPGGDVHGTIDRVGRDHCDVAVHEPGQTRRANAVSQYRLVPFRRILYVVVR